MRVLLETQAKRHGTKIIDEDGLFELIRATSHLVPKEAPPPLPQPTSGGAQLVLVNCWQHSA